MADNGIKEFLFGSNETTNQSRGTSSGHQAGSTTTRGGRTANATSQQQTQNQFQAANPAQQALLNQMIQAFRSGSGEFGFGPAVQQGQATAANILANRGISPQSGQAISALQGIITGAIGNDTAARRQQGLNLVTAAPQMLQTGSTTTGQQQTTEESIMRALQNMFTRNQFERSGSTQEPGGGLFGGLVEGAKVAAPFFV